jgi:hypothetical protein
MEWLQIVFFWSRRSTNKNMMGKFQITGYLRYAGWVATLVMAAAAAIMFISAFQTQN